MGQISLAPARVVEEPPGYLPLGPRLRSLRARRPSSRNAAAPAFLDYCWGREQGQDPPRLLEASRKASILHGPMLQPRKILITLLVVVCLAVPEGTWAIRPYRPRHPDPVLQSWRWRSFPELRGMGLRCFAQAGNGSLWFGTDEGVTCYDGLRWTTYGPSDGLRGTPVNYLCAGRDGSVYAGTDMGIARFHGGSWRPVFPLEKKMPWPIDNLVEAPDGSLWAGTAWGALHLDGSVTTLFTTHDVLPALNAVAPWLRVSVVPDHAVPVYPWSPPGVSGVGVRFAEGGFLGVRRGSAPAVICQLAPGGPGEEAGLRLGDTVSAVDGREPLSYNEALAGPEGANVSLTVHREGVGEPFDVTLTRRNAAGSYRRFWVVGVLVDQSEKVWFGLRGRGRGHVVRFDPPAADQRAHSGWRLFTEADGLEAGPSHQLTQTRDGSVWSVSNYSRMGVNRFDGRSWEHFRLADVGGQDTNTSILETEDGVVWIGGPALHALKNGRWRVYRSPEIPIPSHRTRLLEAADGALWVAGLGQEAVRLDYSSDRWITYEGLHYQCQSPDGSLWFLSDDWGVVRSRGGGWERHGEEDGLISEPRQLAVGRDGTIWAAGSHDSSAATARFDGNGWVLQTHPRLSWGSLPQLYESRDGSMWLAAGRDYSPRRGQMGGAIRFQGNALTHYPVPDAPMYIHGIGESSDGVIWFGGRELRCFDGRGWRAASEPKELTSSWCDVVYTTRMHGMWVGTRTYGAFHYDGTRWTRHHVRNGLADNLVESILQTGDGTVWVATAAGISRFDGKSWVTHAVPVELASGIARNGLRETEDGAIWFNRLSTTTGRMQTTRYFADTAAPETEIGFVLAEVSQPGNSLLAWEGVDPWGATASSRLLYAQRLDGGEWSSFSPEKSHVYDSLTPGPHTFEVKARDLDFNEDPTPAIAHFTVIPPVWQQAWFLSLLVVFLGVTGVLGSRVVARTRERDRARDELLEELEGELRDAHDLQMALMPTSAPSIEGYEIAGRCVPANHVGGDYFQYFEREGRLLLALVDVTGRAMQAAIPVVMFSGLLKSQVELGGTLEELFERLNRSLCGALKDRTLVCLALGELDAASGTLRLSNAACPYPYHFRSSTGEVVELQATAYPLGIRPDTRYDVVEARLTPGDYVLLCSDGMVETASSEGEQFGYDRAAEAVRAACAEGLSAEAMIERLLQVAERFREGEPQEDDTTCVVLRAL